MLFALAFFRICLALIVCHQHYNISSYLDSACRSLPILGSFHAFHDFADITLNVALRGNADGVSCGAWVFCERESHSVSQ